jgi:hypothetical protein
MPKQISIKQAEQKVFKTAVNDGLWDLLIASVLLQFAFAPLLSPSLGDWWSSAVFLPFWALLFLIIWLVRKYVVTPRIGSVKFGAIRKKKLTVLTIIMLIVNITAFIIGLFLAFNFDQSGGLKYIAFLAIMVLLASSTAAYYLNIVRIFVYGLLFVTALIGGEWSFAMYQTAHHGFPITFGIAAGIIIITGLTTFFHLLKNNPLPKINGISRENV